MVIGGVILLLGQLLVLGYINLTQLPYHMGFDASCNYLKACEIAKQGTVFTTNFENQTTLYLDSPAPLAGLLFRITGNIFLSYGITNFLIVIAILWVLDSILNTMQTSPIARIVCLNLVICPYLEPEFKATIYNNVDYFCSMLSDAQFYGCKMLIVLMVLKMVLDCEQGKRNYVYIAVTEFMLFISGISGGGYLLVSIVMPLITYYLVRVFIYNSWKEIRNIKMVLLAVGALFIILGKIITVFVLNFESKESSMTLIGLYDFWDNFLSLFLGFLKLFGALPNESVQPVLGIAGIIHMLGLVICCVYIIGTAVIIKCICKNFKLFDTWGMFLCCAAFNILMFTIVNVKDGAGIFQVRYLIPVFLFLTIIVGGFISILSDSLLFKKYGIILALGILLLLDFYGDRKYLKNKGDYDILCKVADEIEELDVPVVYVYGEYMKQARWNLCVIDTDRIYKYIYTNYFNYTTHWGDYTYYDDVAEVMGRNVLISEPKEFENMPEYLKNQYTLYKQVDRYYIYYADVNKIDLLSGPVGDYSVDYPISFGINILEGALDENGNAVSNGKEAAFIEGPFTEIEEGVYDFTINYEIIGAMDGGAKFGISVNNNKDLLGEVMLSDECGTATISNVKIDEHKKGFGYNVYNEKGTILRVDSFEIRKIKESD